MFKKLEELVEKNTDLEVVIEFLGGNNVSYKYYAKVFNTDTNSNVAIAPGCSVENALIALDRHLELRNL